MGKSMYEKSQEVLNKKNVPKVEKGKLKAACTTIMKALGDMEGDGECHLHISSSYLEINICAHGFCKIRATGHLQKFIDEVYDLERKDKSDGKNKDKKIDTDE